LTPRALGLAAAAAAMVVALACDTDGMFGSPRELAQGTWGGQDAGVIVNETIVHVHVGCTNGNFPAPIELDEDGRFSVAGEYLVRAYPVAIGPLMPARLAGVVDGRTLVLTVAVDDTISDELVVFGPVSVRLGQEPQLGPCPICVM